MGKRANCQNLILKVVGCQLLIGVMNGKGIWHEKREREKKGGGGGNQSNYLPTFSKKKKMPHLFKCREELCENKGRTTSLRRMRILVKEGTKKGSLRIKVRDP